MKSALVAAFVAACQVRAMRPRIEPIKTMPVRALDLSVIRGCSFAAGCSSPCRMPAVGFDVRYDGCHWQAYAPAWTGRQ